MQGSDRVHCEYCSKSLKNEKVLKEHQRVNHYEQMVQDGKIKPRIKKASKSEMDDFDWTDELMVESTVKQLPKPVMKAPAVEDASISDISKAHHPHTDSMIPFLKLCIPENHYTDILKESKKLIEEVGQVQSFDEVLRTIDTLRSIGATEENAKAGIIRHFQSIYASDSFEFHKFRLMFERKYSQIKLKAEGWEKSMMTKRQELHELTSRHSWTEAHLFLDAHIKSLSEEQLEKELVFAEYYYMSVVFNKIISNADNLKMKFLKDCLEEFLRTI